jgi:biopolymer transport protein ExbD
MGMSSGGGNKGGVQSEINVTPLIDVLLVLLIIFLVVMPIMMKKETLTIPRDINETQEEPNPDQIFISVKLQADMSVIFNDGKGEDTTIQFPELRQKVADRIKDIKPGTEKAVFVDFADGVKWNDVVQTMDTIRALATDADKDEIKVALTICKPEERKPTGCEKPQ